MTTFVSERTVYDWRCDECGRRDTSSDETRATADAMEHQVFHTTSRLVGPSLKGLVLDTDRTADVPWFGFVTKANDYAKEHGFSFFVWNGWVHTVDSPDLGKPLCYAADVPGTRAAERAA